MESAEWASREEAVAAAVAAGVDEDDIDSDEQRQQEEQEEEQEERAEKRHAAKKEKEMPRREQLIRNCEWPTSQQLADQGNQVDSGETLLLQMAGTSSAMIALLMKQRYIAWLSLLLALATLANMKTYKLKSVKDLMMCLVPPIMAVTMGYVGATQAQWK